MEIEMTIKTIMDNLFGRVMKNGKRIPGTCILAFGTRIFFEDYLLPDDIIICTDWADYASVRLRRKYKHVEFLSESDIKKMVDDGTLYNYIERKYKMRKFDLTVSNPPYDGDLHLQILDTFLKISKQCVFVHPARWMEDVLAQYKAKSATGKKFEHLKTALEKAYLIKMSDGNDAFHIGLPQDMLIGVYSDSDVNSALPIYDDAKRFFSVLKRILNYAHTVKSLNDVDDENKIDGVRVIVKSITPGGKGQGNTEYGKNLDVLLIDSDIIVDGFGEDGKVWFKTNGKIVNQWYKKKSDDTPIPHSIKLPTKDLAQTFIDLYRTNVVKNIIYMLKYDQHSGHTHIPYFDPKSIKTEDDVLNALGITEPKYREWLKREVYDYREKDFIKYNEWIDC